MDEPQVAGDYGSIGREDEQKIGNAKARLNRQPLVIASDPSPRGRLSADKHKFAVEMEFNPPQLAHFAAGVTLMMPTSTNWPPFVW